LAAIARLTSPTVTSAGCAPDTLMGEGKPFVSAGGFPSLVIMKETIGKRADG
jgi:hypothetical protein